MENDYFVGMNEAWKNTTASTNEGYESLPDGVYQVKVDTAQLKQGNVPFIQWGLRVVSGQHINRMIFKVSRIVPEALPYLKADLELLRACPENISDIESTLPSALDAILDVRLKSGTSKDGKPYQNVYFNKLVREGGTVQVPEGFTPVDEKCPWEE